VSAFPIVLVLVLDSASAEKSCFRARNAPRCRPKSDPITITSTIEDEEFAYDAPLSQGLSVNHSKTEGTKGTFLIVVVLDSDLRKERLPAPQRKEPDNDNKRD
jgi:hypothetical protein